MSIPIEMPQLDYNVAHSTLITWLKKEGDSINQGEVVAEIETDKIVIEVAAPSSGILRKVMVPNGTTVPVGSLLGIITTEDEEAPTDEEIQAFRETISDQIRLPISPMRRSIANRTASSVSRAPHFYVVSEIDMEPITNFRRTLRNSLPKGVKVGLNDLIVTACARAIEKRPSFNSYFDDNHIVKNPHINIGIAVALSEGLIIPVVSNCENRDLISIAENSKIVIERARAGSLLVEEYAQCTFAISNLGMYDIDSFTAIIYPPNAAVLAIGSVKTKPLIKNNQVVVGRTMKVTLSIDHRVNDGAEAAKFLRDVKWFLEHPECLKPENE